MTVDNLGPDVDDGYYGVELKADARGDERNQSSIIVSTSM